MNQLAKTEQPKEKNILGAVASKYNVEPQRLLNSLKSVAFRQKDGVVIGDDQMVALLIVADQYGLNPFTKEIYAYPDKNGGIVPVVGVDGWNRITTSHKQYDGETCEYSENIVQLNQNCKPCPEWCKITIYRKDHKYPSEHTEYLDEVYRAMGPWQTHTKRMLKHKARIQCARQAFGFAGIYDEDEAVRIIEAEVVASESTKKAPSIMPKRIAQEQPPVPAPAQQPEPLPQPEMTAEEKEYIAVLESGEKDA